MQSPDADVVSTKGSQAQETQTDDASGGRGPGSRNGKAALTLAALGVVFGDIGTSPLYAFNAIFTTEGVPRTPQAIYGVVSLVFWALTLVVSVKYVTFVMRAHREGEGGIMALLALVERARVKRGVGALLAMGLFGAALFYGDGIITPAISVLSAVEGLEVAAPSLQHLVVPIALAVLVVFFGVQRFGTGSVGHLFGPVMLVWFGVLALSGLAKVITHPSILAALSPTYAFDFVRADGTVAFFALGGVVLALTGAEALYADRGHFGPAPIRRAWFLLVFPALMLNYMAQGALILESPAAVSRPFFSLLPPWAQLPAVFLATAATVIASQAVISGVFSITRQAMQLHFLPRVYFRHTSGTQIGQVYSTGVNTLLLVGVAALVLGFGSSSALAGAYGLAVTGTMVVTTVLFLVVVRSLWRKPRWIVAGGCLGFLVVDLALFIANVPKVVEGAWFPLVVAVVIFVVLTTWSKGYALLTSRRREEEGKLADFIEEVRSLPPPLYRTPGTAVFLHANAETTPLALRENVDRNRVLHESVVIVSVEIVGRAQVPTGERLTVDDLGYRDDGISHATARFGFREKPDVPKALSVPAVGELEGNVDLDDANYFLSQITIVAGDAPGMARWRKRLFIAISRAAANSAEFFVIPRRRVVTLGTEIEL